MEFLKSGPLDSICAIFLAGVFLWGFNRAGCFLAGIVGARLSGLSPLERFLYRAGSGIVLFSATVFFLGVSGCLSGLPILIALASLTALSFLVEKRPARESSILKELVSFLARERAFGFAAAAILGLAMLQALAPPIGNDALAYHLDHVRRFILNGRIAYVPWTRESLWPYLGETLFAAGLLFEGTMLAQLFHWMFYGLTTGLVYACGKRLHGASAGKLAALFFLFTPVAFAQAGHAYVDLILAFFVFGAVFAVLLAEELKDAKIFLLAGTFIAGALSTKYLGLGAFAVLWLLVLLRTRSLKSLLYFSIPAVIFSAFWYAHSWIAIGNPVYPFFPKFFGGNGFEFDIAEGVGMGKDLFAFSKLGWNMTMHPFSFGGEMIGPLFLMLVPLGLISWKYPKKGSAFLISFCVFYTYFLFTQSQHLRFYLSVAPLLAVGAAWGLLKVWRERSVWVKIVVAGCLLLVCTAHSAIFVYRTRHVWPVIAGRMTASEYLLRFERSYEGYLFLKEHLKPSEKFFNAAEVRQFYDPTKDRMDFESIPLRRFLQERGISLEQFLDKERYSYIWTSTDTTQDIRAYLKSRRYQKVYAYDFIEKPGVFKYEIYQSYDR